MATPDSDTTEVHTVFCTRVGVGTVTFRLTPGETIPFRLAVIVELPGATPVADPSVLIVAKVLSLEFHVAALVRFTVLPSEKCPVAVNCSLCPTVIDFAGFGVTTIVCRLA